MTRLYKLTDQKNRTRARHPNVMQWGENVTHAVELKGTMLCSPEVIHAYEHPLIAVIFNTMHAGIDTPKLWEAEGEIIAREGQLKVGVKMLTTLRELEVPTITAEQLIAFGIRVVLASQNIIPPSAFIRWAHAWLSGDDRSESSILLVRNDCHGHVRTYAYIIMAALWCDMCNAHPDTNTYSSINRYICEAISRHLSLAPQTFDLFALAQVACQKNLT